MQKDPSAAGAQPSVSTGDDEEPIVLGATKARAATMNRMTARVLIVSLTLTAALFAIGYLLVR